MGLVRDLGRGRDLGQVRVWKRGMMEGEWVMVWVMVWNRVRMEDESVMVWVRDLDRVRRDGWMDR
jgi:hypothetical protein